MHSNQPEEMKISCILLVSFCVFVIICCSSGAASGVKHDSIDEFLQCSSLHSQNHTSVSNVIYTQKNDSYSSILNFNIQNLRFASPSTPKPVAIITPLHEYQIQPVIYCSKKHDLQIRVRSGGHDYEGLSYTSQQVPFVIIDLVNLRSIDVDIVSRTAWVQSGATIEELYNKIAEKSRTLGFPAAVGTTVGVGGHFSGGGYGMLLRKYGLAADNVIDARLVDANGRILDRKSMGEDLFWAIRGGGGGSFGVVLAWKVKLVPVPHNVTVFSIQKTLEQNATQLIHRWQCVAHKLHEDLKVVIVINRVNSSKSSDKITIQAAFLALFLGGVDRLVPLMQQSFPELGLAKEDCIEMSWIESASYFGARSTPSKEYFKAKSDYVKQPMPIKAFEGLWQRLSEKEAEASRLLLIPYGGKMDKISESATPFPHRAGNLYKIYYGVYWNGGGKTASQRRIKWIRRLYKYMAPYVSKNPRAAYINYRDLDLGVNNKAGNTSYTQASIWGTKYFNNNFHRLAQVKTMVDPSNFFRHEQSIPLLS